jgi:cytoskeleton protein RodZ
VTLTEGARLNPADAPADAAQPRTPGRSSAEAPADAAQPRTPGRILAAARQARGMSVTDVAARLKFSPRQITALEEDRYDALPVPAIARGMVRNYAKLFGLDAAPLIADLQSRLGSAPATVAPPHLAAPFSRAGKRGVRVYWLLSILVLLSVGAVVGEMLLGRLRAPVAPAPEAAAPAAPAPEPPPPPSRPEPAPPAPTQVAEPPGPKRIELIVSKESWVEIRDADGRVLLSQTSLPGARSFVEGKAPFAVVIGRPPGVRLLYGGVDVDLAPYASAGGVARFTLK